MTHSANYPDHHSNPGAMFLRLCLVLPLAAILVGCANHQMALDKKMPHGLALEKPIGIFTLRTENILKPKYQPEVKLVEIVSNDSRQKSTFEPRKPHAEQKSQYNEYLVSVDLTPGSFQVERVRGVAGDQFFVSGHFEFPVGTTFNLPPGSVTYLGHVEMKNRERQKDEKRSGGVLPLIDQSVCGFSSGTFDITITDRSDIDIPAFKQAYPILNDVTIGTSLMHR